MKHGPLGWPLAGKIIFVLSLLVLAVFCFVLAATIVHAADWPLCVDGHPNKRPPTHYAGLPTCPTAERNHIVPRCLGGPDTLANLEYLPWALAIPGDTFERETCEAYCRGQISLDAARARFRRRYGLSCPG